MSSETPYISIVDDDESVREALRSLLRSVGYRTQVFASAEDFLSSDQRNRTDCLILDVQMPGMGGLELQQRLSAERFGIPIIFITAHGDEVTRAGVLQAGAVDFLNKPFSEEALLGGIRLALEQRAA